MDFDDLDRAEDELERGAGAGARAGAGEGAGDGAEAEAEAESEAARSGRRVAFVDFWPGFEDGTDRWVTRRWFEENLVDADVVHPSDDPGVVVFSVFGYEHCRHASRGRSKLVFYTGENLRPPIGEVPTCLSFDRLPDVPAARHMRLPIWLLNREVGDVVRLHEARLRGEAGDAAKRRGFCSWVASNVRGTGDAELRLRFVQLLQRRYKDVACGGEALNNVGGPVADKIAFLRSYRFNVCFENASHPGYCTEKLLHAFAAGCVPIYWGDPAMSRAGSGADFNPAALISAHDFASLEDIVDFVAEVDRDPELFAGYLRQPILSEHWYQRLRDRGSFRRELTDVILAGAEFRCVGGDPVGEDDCLACGNF